MIIQITVPDILAGSAQVERDNFQGIADCMMVFCNKGIKLEFYLGSYKQSQSRALPPPTPFIKLLSVLHFHQHHGVKLAHALTLNWSRLQETSSQSWLFYCWHWFVIGLCCRILVKKFQSFHVVFRTINISSPILNKCINPQRITDKSIFIHPLSLGQGYPWSLYSSLTGLQQPKAWE